MVRRATAIKELSKGFEGPVLVLDAGSSLTGQWVSLKSEGRVSVDAMNLMKYDALAIGRMDLAIGLDALLEREKEAEFAFLSDNLIYLSDQSPVFTPYIVIERAGRKIGIIGVSDPEALQAPGIPDKLTLLDPIEATRGYVERLNPEVDMVVVLSNLGMDQDKALAGSIPGIDLVVGGKDLQLMQEPERLNDTLFIQQGSRGEWMGSLTIGYDDEDQLVSAKAEIITLDDTYAEDEEMMALVEPYREEYPTPTPQPSYTPDPRTPTADLTKTVAAFQTQIVEITTATAAAASK